MENIIALFLWVLVDGQSYVFPLKFFDTEEECVTVLKQFEVPKVDYKTALMCGVIGEGD